MRLRLSLVLAPAVAMLPAIASGDFDLTWGTTGGGGGASAGGAFSLTGTVGQAVAGVALAGGSFTMSGGFWPGANGSPPSPPCPGDTNGDGLVDVNDLNNVILDWGSDGSAHGGDLGGALPGSPPDGVVDVNDLNAVIIGWGACV